MVLRILIIETVDWIHHQRPLLMNSLNNLDATRELHVIPLNSEEGTFFLNVILPLAYSNAPIN